MATIFIWNNNVWGRGHHYPGHVSINITDEWSRSYAKNNTDNYVSWWPHANSSLASGSGHKMAEPKANIFTDLVAEKYAPDHIIRLTSTIQQKENMKKAWTAIRTKEVKTQRIQMRGVGGVPVTYADVPVGGTGPSYRYYKKNCSVIVQKVLKAGGYNWGNSNLFHMKSTIWTPLNIKRLAMSYKGAKTISWEHFVSELINAGSINKAQKVSLDWYLKRALKHGSSGATPRNFSGGLKASYSNDRIIEAIKKIDNT